MKRNPSSVEGITVTSSESIITEYSASEYCVNLKVLPPILFNSQ